MAGPIDEDITGCGRARRKLHMHVLECDGLTREDPGGLGLRSEPSATQRY